MPNGQGIPPAFPSLVGSPIATGPRDAHLEIIVNGKAGTAMQAFGKQLDAAQIAAVTHYERHSWGNSTDDITQPRDVIAFTEAQQQ
jgi:cytochrome c oxidase subunit 2